jgi:PPOX class probable F420-dependent enzyme
MNILERFARFNDGVFDRLRDKQAFTLDEEYAVDGDFAALRGHTYALVVTFRRNGDAVPSPAWFAIDERGVAFVKTRHDAGKVKRLRNDPRVLLAPSNVRGKPAGRAVRATGRVLPEEEWPHAVATLVAAYGLGRKVSERVLGGPGLPAAYLEITSGRPDEHRLDGS